MCSSGVGFNPVLNGVTYTFDVIGVYKGLFVMADRQTGSVWTHFDGSVLSGPLAGQGLQLAIAPILQTSWADWQQQHPDTVVLDWYSEFARNYGDFVPGKPGGGFEYERSLFEPDNRLPENEMVVGVGAGSEFRAYVLKEFNSLSVVADTLGELRIVVLIDPATLAGLAYVPEVDNQWITLSVVNGAIVDDLGNTWNLNGQAVSGPNQGAQLPFVTSFVTEWYGWAAYHPETTIYQK